MLWRLSSTSTIVAVLTLLAACGDSDPRRQPAATPTASPQPTATPTPLRFCDLPGSIRVTESERTVVPGGPASTGDLDFLQIPTGFCAHVFADVGNPRQLRFAPSGELFVASPTKATASYGLNGADAILVLPDDDHDGVADSQEPFLSGMPATFGMAFAGDSFYYQNETKILRTAYRPGDRRAAAGAGDEVADIRVYESELHWPKPIDIADDGTIYVGNGGDQGEICDPTRPFRGGVLKVDGTSGGAQVAKGFRNPIAVRCLRGHNRCFAVELARDLSQRVGGREKLAEIHSGDDWGFPCCAAKDLPYPEFTAIADCSGIIEERGSFLIGHTPFDVDFETGRWPAPWTHRAFVPLHGSFATWVGADLVALEIDPLTGQLLAGSTLDEQAPGSLLLFASGWDDRTLSHGRPTAVAFAPDGRLFLSDDQKGLIVWIAPLQLEARSN